MWLIDRGRNGFSWRYNLQQLNGTPAVYHLVMCMDVIKLKPTGRATACYLHPASRCMSQQCAISLDFCPWKTGIVIIMLWQAVSCSLCFFFHLLVFANIGHSFISMLHSLTWMLNFPSSQSSFIVQLLCEWKANHSLHVMRQLLPSLFPKREFPERHFPFYFFSYISI